MDAGALTRVSLGRIAVSDSHTIDPAKFGADLLAACSVAFEEQDIAFDPALFEQDFWGARRAPDTRDALVRVAHPSWAAEQPRPRLWVQQLGSGRAVLDAGDTEAEFLWRCCSCSRWAARICAGCGEDLGAQEALKRRRTGAAAKATCAQQPLSARLGRLRPFFALSTEGGLALHVKVSLLEQMRTLARALHWRPLAARLRVRFVPTGSSAPWATEAEEAPTATPALELVQADEGEDCAPLEELVPGVEPSAHRPAQAASVAWALQRDRDGTWQTQRRMLLACHPQHDVAMQLRLSATYSCRGGVLAQSMGTGKTLAALCLIAARPAPAPERLMAPELHRVSCTLILAAVSNVAEGTWQHDAARHLDALTPPFKLRTVASPKHLREVTVAELSRLDALVLPQTALDWLCFQKGMADPPRERSETDAERCEHLRRCLHFQRSRAAAIAADIRATPARASRWTLADVGPAGVCWERLVVDELPELLGDRPWTFGKALLQAVEAPRRWGLTATPKLDAQGLQAACDFLRVSTAGSLAAQWSELARTLFRGGSWDTTAIDVTHVTHRIRLSGLERAVYESEYARAHSSSRCDRMASCVRKCTHWRDSAESPDDALSLPEACERSLAALNRLIEDRARDVGEQVGGGAAYVAEVRRMREEELARLRVQGRYVSAVFEAMTASPCEECPICLTRFAGTEVRLITPCGHVFHEACLHEARVEGRPLCCPNCRKPVLQRLPLRCPLPRQGDSRSEVVLQPIKMRPQAGEQRTSSKIAYLASFLKSHSQAWRATRGAAGKVLVLVQWSDMRLRLEEALCAEAVPFVAHKGQLAEARDNLQSFLQEEPDSPVVLLATFERRLGINVQKVAAHVVLVHPFVDCKATHEGNTGLRPAQAEEQALARVVRPGQTRPVFLHRLVGADTVEETMIAVPPEAWHRRETRDA